MLMTDHLVIPSYPPLVKGGRGDLFGDIIG